MSELSDLLKAEEARAAIGDTGAGGSPPPVPPPADLSEAAKKKLQRQIREAILSGYRKLRVANKESLPDPKSEDAAIAKIVKGFDFQNVIHTAFSEEGIHTEGSLKAYETARARDVNQTVVQPQNRQQKDESASVRDVLRAAAEKARGDAKDRAHYEAIVKAQYSAGEISQDDYEGFLAGKTFDSNLPINEQTRAARGLGSLGAKRRTKEKSEAARQIAAEKAEATQRNKGQIRQDKDEEWLRRDE